MSAMLLYEGSSEVHALRVCLSQSAAYCIDRVYMIVLSSSRLTQVRYNASWSGALPSTWVPLVRAIVSTASIIHLMLRLFVAARFGPLLLPSLMIGMRGARHFL